MSKDSTGETNALRSQIEETNHREEEKARRRARLAHFGLPIPDVDFSYASPFCGVAVLAHHPNPLRRMFEHLHEATHVDLTDSTHGVVMRELIGSLHQGIEQIARGRKAVGMELPALVPGFRNCPYMTLRIQLVSELLYRSLCAHEAIATWYAAMNMRRLARDGHHQLTVEDVNALERQAIDGQERRLEGFRNLYVRFAKLMEVRLQLFPLIRKYVFNAPPEQIFCATVLTPGSGNRNPDGQDDVRRSIELVRGGGWESPDSRFLQVLDVAEQVPLAALDNLDAVGLLFQQHLRGFAGSLVRGAKDPKEMNIPGFGMTRQVSSRMLSLSRIIWRRAGGELAEACLKGGASQDNLDRLRVHRMIHTFETLGTIKRIPSGQGSLTIKCEAEPERVLVREVLEYEFLREQLQAGKGLECMYDILPLTRRPEGYWEGRRTRHHALMEGLWENTQLDPDRDTQRYANCEWLPPTCLDDKPWTKKNRRSR